MKVIQNSTGLKKYHLYHL